MGDGRVVLTRVDATHWTITLTGKETTQIEYKYTLGDFNYVEKDGSCGEIGNRQVSLSYGSTGTQEVNETRSSTGAMSLHVGTDLRVA